MRAVVISNTPMTCKKIADGDCTVLVRKTRPKLAAPFKAYIYCTKSKSESLTIRTGVDEIGNPTHVMNGKVIGEFVCDRIEPFDVPYPAWSREYLNPILNGACLTYSDLHSYIGSGNRGYAWHISNLVIYDKPKSLEMFPTGKIARDCGCGGYIVYDTILTRPPRSWCYVKEKERI